MEKQILDFMEKLDITREESIELIAFDKGEIENEEVDSLTIAAKPVQKLMTQVSRKPEEEKPKMAGVTTQTRKRKEDLVKRLIIEKLNLAINEIENVENIEVANIEKTILFKIGKEKFEVDLIKKRK